jgi:hypothetical protein
LTSVGWAAGIGFPKNFALTLNRVDTYDYYEFSEIIQISKILGQIFWPDSTWFPGQDFGPRELGSM